MKKNYVLDTGAGDSFSNVAKEAKEIAKAQDVIVEFDFNGVLCLVDKETYIPNLEKYFHDAHIMEWETIGPEYEWDYDVDTEIELCTRRLNRAKQRKTEQEQQEIKDNAEKEKVDALTAGIELNIWEDKKEEYAAYVTTNSNDSYSRGVIDYGEAWAKLMQVEISKGKTVRECAEYSQKPLGYMGISGFMYGCAVQALSHFWKHGEDLRKWHNKEYGVSEDAKGVVNPAILTIG